MKTIPDKRSAAAARVMSKIGVVSDAYAVKVRRANLHERHFVVLPWKEPVSFRMHLRPATRADLPRIHQVRHGTTENRLGDPSSVSDAEVAWYMDHAIFLVSEDGGCVQGFACVNLQTGYVWALFVIEGAQGQGHGTALLSMAMAQLREAGHRQSFLSTGKGTKAETFYMSQGWQPTGINMQGEVVLRLWL